MTAALLSPYAKGEIYYDNQKNYGVNAYFAWGHHYFVSMREFLLHIDRSEKRGSYTLVEITDDNYTQFVQRGVFAHVE